MKHPLSSFLRALALEAAKATGVHVSTTFIHKNGVKLYGVRCTKTPMDYAKLISLLRRLTRELGMRIDYGRSANWNPVPTIWIRPAHSRRVGAALKR